MKRNSNIVFSKGLAIALVVGLMIGFSPFVFNSGQAFADGSDDFNDNSKDVTKWGTDEVDGKGMLNEVNQRLEYTTSGVGTAPHDSVDRPWVSTRFPYNADWAIQIDVTNTTSGEFNSFGIDIRSSRLPDNEIEVELAQSGQYWAEFYGGTWVSGDDYANFLSGNTHGALQIAFDSNTKTFTVSYDADPSNGYQWQPFGTFRVDGSGGADNVRNWGLNDSDQFVAYVFGYSEGISVASGELYGDNFQETGGVEPATIEIISPANDSSFDACSYFNPPLFQWSLPDTFRKLELNFYTTNPAKPTKVKVKDPTVTQLQIPANTWKKILKLPGLSGGEVNFKIVGTNKGQPIVESDVYTMTIAAPEPVESPLINPTSKTGLPPTLTWGNACGTKFKAYFSPDGIFSRKKKLAFTDKDPTDNEGRFTTTLTNGTWNAIRKLVSDAEGSTIYWYIESWDVIKRYQRIDNMQFTLQP
jgi:hypothetical protein